MIRNEIINTIGRNYLITNIENDEYSYPKASTEKGGVLTIDSAVLGYCSYQEKNFSASDHVEVLTPKFPMNKYIALFLTTLPVTPSGEPDWQYMEDYIKSLPYSKNLEPSDPKEVVDELMEVKRHVIEMERKMEAMNGASTVNIIGSNVTYFDQSRTFNVEK